VINGDGLFAEPNDSIRQAFRKGQTKHIKYIKKLNEFTMLYAAHILDPCCRMEIIETIMLAKKDEVTAAVKSYFITK
jgi:hypothetical protein